MPTPNEKTAGGPVVTVRVEQRIWSKGSARGAGPQKQKRSVGVRLGAVSVDTPMCMHGVAMRRCDDCGDYIASHPGAVPHACGERRASCADGGAP